MSAPGQFEATSGEAVRLLGLVERLLACTSPANFAEIVLPEFAAIGGSNAAFPTTSGWLPLVFTFMGWMKN